MNQLLCHLLGDYFLQGDYLALNKSKKTLPCLIHVLLYTAAFLFITTSWKVLLVIGVTHFIFDRWSLVKYIIYIKNRYFFNPNPYPPFDYCSTTGFYDESPVNKRNYTELDASKWGKPRPFYITIWLYIICDNSVHLFCNYMALTYLQ